MMAVTLVEAAWAPELRVWTSEQEDDSADAVTLNLAEGSMGTEGRVRLRRDSPTHTSSDAHKWAEARCVVTMW